MKRWTTFFLLVISAGISSAQVGGARGTVLISDNRKAGVTQYDSSTTGHKAGDVVVKRVLKNIAGKQVDAYDVYFYRMYNKKLYSYYTALADTIIYNTLIFDKASFIWQLDTILRITLKSKGDKYGRDVVISLPNSPGGLAATIERQGPPIKVKAGTKE